MVTKMERQLRKKIDWQENQVCSQVAMMMKMTMITKMNMMMDMKITNQKI